MTQDHYKAVVEAGEATEVRIDLVCDTSAGGLDVIVTESVAPVVTDLHFTFADSGLAANKYICNCGRDVRAEVQVIDADTACANLVPTWSAVDSAQNDVTATLLSDFQAAPGNPCSAMRRSFATALRRAVHRTPRHWTEPPAATATSAPTSMPASAAFAGAKPSRARCPSTRASREASAIR